MEGGEEREREGEGGGGGKKIARGAKGRYKRAGDVNDDKILLGFIDPPPVSFGLFFRDISYGMLR